MSNNQVVSLCSCCVDARPLFQRQNGAFVCLASGHVYEQRGDSLYDTERGMQDYERQQNYMDLEFPTDARPTLISEKIDLSRYGYS